MSEKIIINNSGVTSECECGDGNQVSGDAFVFPVSPTQAALWFVYQMDQESSAYNIPLGYRLRGKLDADALRVSCEQLMARHEVLRTVFSDDSGELKQHVQEQAILPWHFESVESLSGDARETQINALIKKQCQTPFDLKDGPVWRICLLALAADEYILLITFHHIAVDHIALGVLMDELTAIYAELSQNREALLPDPDLQYADYVVWFEENIESTSSDDLDTKQLDYWVKHLSGYSGYLNLPTDNSRSPVQTSSGAEYRFEVPGELAANLRQFSRQSGVSLFNSTLATLQLLLQRYCGQDDIIVGTPFANRGQQEELENVVGCFINTLPIAVNLSGTPTFRELLQTVKKTVLEAHDKQDTPLESIIGALKIKRDPSYHNLFQVGFVFQEPPVAIDLHGVKATDLRLHSGGSMYDLHIWLWDAKADGSGQVASSGAMGGLIWYNSDLYHPATVAQFVNHYLQLLTELLSSPDQPACTLSLLDDREKLQLASFNPSRQAYPEQQLLPYRFSEQVARHPDAVAVIADGKQLSYIELEQRSNQLANHLRENGVASGVFVGLCVHRSIDMVVCLLGILKAGSAYVPLDPDYPVERLRYMLESAAVPVLLTEQGLASIVDDFQCQRICIDSDWDTINTQSDASPAVVVQPDDLAYVIFTSGSTGKPKGVQVPHSALMNFLQSMAEQPGLTADDKILAVTTLSFDIAVLELYLPLFTGATVVIADRAAQNDGQALVQLLEQQGVTTMQATPSTWRLLLLSGWRGADTFKALCGGEALPPDLAAELLACTGELWNMYGPTETTVWSTCFRVTDANAPILIGKPIANTQCHVLDEHLQPLPVGIPGELYIGGDGVTAGYLNQQTLTAERFIADPFCGNADARLYRTGDLVRWCDSGNLDYLRRVDNQVKLRGFRIELGEIEAVLSQYSSVSQCVVIVREDRPGDQRLVAYAVLGQGGMTVTEMREHLRELLPEYMIPSQLVVLAELPLTHNGKIDQKSLPAPVGTGAEPTVVPPETEAEVYLSELWEKLLGIAEISASDNFFDLGGHSILAAECVAHVRAECGVDISLRAVLLNTLAEIASEFFTDAQHTQDTAPTKRSVSTGEQQSNKNSFWKAIKKRFKTEQP